MPTDDLLSFSEAEIAAAIYSAGLSAAKSLETEENFKVINLLPSAYRGELSARVLARTLDTEAVSRELFGASRFCVLSNLPHDGDAATVSSIELGLGTLFSARGAPALRVQKPLHPKYCRRFPWEKTDERPATQDLVMILNEATTELQVQLATPGDLLCSIDQLHSYALEQPEWRTGRITEHPLPVVVRDVRHCPHITLSPLLQPATARAQSAMAEVRLTLQNARLWSTVSLAPGDTLIAQPSLLRRGLGAAYGWFGNICDEPVNTRRG